MAALFHEGLTFEQITEHLHEQYNLNVNLLQRLPTEVKEQVKKRIQVLFFEIGLENKNMLYALKNEGF
ncbi:hypothetical protein K469DRAFT_707492 [Zopfia rhizophila CBS 207.26]|uniref:Uncharacterized protein n=1 Tax=Zopfia rhizophila CBS 207.26 TaxID=1314779 RepID=A0A6A6E3T2_9PEZI|nr:hypothetical protein K469DRAFT_707492 [Zopfia rhizophila CBS 207.26]